MHVKFINDKTRQHQQWLRMFKSEHSALIHQDILATLYVFELKIDTNALLIIINSFYKAFLDVKTSSMVLKIQR